MWNVILRGKKHSLNVIRRNNVVNGGVRTNRNMKNGEDSKTALEFQRKVETMRQQLRYDNGLPKVDLVHVKDPKTENKGVSIRVVYLEEDKSNRENEKALNEDETDGSTVKQDFSPFLRVITGLELSHSKDRNKKVFGYILSTI